jgi:thioredoxin-like negative regulator of GroEL
VRAKPSVFMMVIVAATFLACGSEEQAQVPGIEGALPDVSVEGVDGVAEAEIEIAVDEAVAGCLQWVQEEAYEDAVPACTEALEADPGNVDVQVALALAQENVAAALTEEAMEEAEAVEETQ